MIRNSVKRNPPKPLRPLQMMVASALILFTGPALVSATTPHPMSGMTPPELLDLVRSDISSGNPDRAASTFMVALAYSFYDARRASGNGSRKAFADSAALALSDLPTESLGAFATAGRNLSSNHPKISALLTATGHPSYDLSHLGEGTATQEGFDPASAWSEIISGISRPQLMPR